MFMIMVDIFAHYIRFIYWGDLYLRSVDFCDENF